MAQKWTQERVISDLRIHEPGIFKTQLTMKPELADKDRGAFVVAGSEVKENL